MEINSYFLSCNWLNSFKGPTILLTRATAFWKYTASTLEQRSFTYRRSSVFLCILFCAREGIFILFHDYRSSFLATITQSRAHPLSCWIHNKDIVFVLMSRIQNIVLEDLKTEQTKNVERFKLKQDLALLSKSVKLVVVKA